MLRRLFLGSGLSLCSASVILSLRTLLSLLGFYYTPSTSPIPCRAGQQGYEGAHFPVWPEIKSKEDSRQHSMEGEFQRRYMLQQVLELSFHLSSPQKKKKMLVKVSIQTKRGAAPGKGHAPEEHLLIAIPSLFPVGSCTSLGG